ncbi:hypothetical protein PTTG_06385, partial [Puccinia triticina 1-1 BBBD Race 1]
MAPDGAPSWATSPGRGGSRELHHTVAEPAAGRPSGFRGAGQDRALYRLVGLRLELGDVEMGQLLEWLQREARHCQDSGITLSQGKRKASKPNPTRDRATSSTDAEPKRPKLDKPPT